MGTLLNAFLPSSLISADASPAPPGSHGADVSYRRDSPSNQRVITAPREVPVTHFLQTSRFYYMPALHMLVSADYLLRLLNRGAVTLRRHTFDDSYPQLGP